MIASVTPKTAANAAPRGRLIELDILRGFLLVWMTLTHLPTKASIVSNQTFGFVSGAEGFIFLAAFMMGQLEHRLEEKKGEGATVKDILRRTGRIYVYHCGLLFVAFTLVAAVGVTFQRMALQNLLSYYLQHPAQGIIAALLLEYRPSLLDILPMYIVFMILSPMARKMAQVWSWKPVVVISFTVWAAAQFGLRAWVYGKGDLFGLSVPQNATGAFDLYGWQLLWMIGLALGSTAPLRTEEIRLPTWLVRAASVVAVTFLILRYCPVDQWINANLFGWLVDKWHLGLVRIIDFSAVSIVLVRFGASIAKLPFMMPLASLGQASLAVFCIHVLCCLFGVSLSHEADPALPLWQQAFLLIFTLSALFLTADLAKKQVARKTPAS